MSLFTMEHRMAAYRADFVLYGAAIAGLAIFLLMAVPRGQQLEAALFAGTGLALWTVIEYALHRFVMHGLQPFTRLHAEHHRRPTALIFTPTILSAMLIVTLVFLPSLVLLDNLWHASALTLGVLVGYLSFSVTHHAVHHWRADSAWLKQRKRWHALHHHTNGQSCCFGVTSAFWDHVFGSARRR
jgi:sterol desaturase/sphingolipid hydroxylase (fatty acid hydroxylase superfamily)